MSRSPNGDDAGAVGRAVSPAQFSSASGLSSPPRSESEPGSPSQQFANESSTSLQNSSITVNPPGVEYAAPGPSASKPEVVQPPARKKPGRKPKIQLANANADSSATNTDVNAPKTRKPRKPRDPNAPPQRRRKNHSTEPLILSEITPAAGPPPRQPSQPIILGPDPNANVRPDAPPHSQNGKNEDIQPRPVNSFFTSGPPPPPQQPYQHQQPLPQAMRSTSSGQNYDPIRSNYDPVRETVVNHPPPAYNSQGSPGQPHSMNRASASPSISSLVDPPNQALTSPSIAAQSFFNQQQARLQHEGHGSVPPSPTVNRLAPSAVVESSPKPPVHPGVAPRKSDTSMVTIGSTAMSKKNSLGPGSTATSSAAASPKPPKIKDSKEIYPAPPPLPGSGLMQLGGMGGAPGDGTEFRAPTVILNIPMNGEVNKIINFTRMAEDRYGWDALHPRLAAQRDRLARVAAAGAALERNGSGRDSGDDMSLDSDDGGSNIEMGGMSDGRTGTDGGVKKVPRKRKMKEDEYDKDDGFVDDSELLWEEQAAAATDGFFVYSGPLVPEGDKPPVETRYVLNHPFKKLFTNIFAELMAYQSVAEVVVVVVVDLVVVQAPEEVLLQLQLEQTQV